MGNVNKINLEHVTTVLNSDQTYNISADWSTEESPEPYAGNYKVEIVDGGTTLSFDDTSAKQVALQNVTLDKSKSYVLRISAQSTPTVSGEAAVLLHSYEDIRLEYDCSVLRLFWDKPSGDIHSGLCEVTCTSGTYAYEIPEKVPGMAIPFEADLYGAEDDVSVKLTPYADAVTSGPVAESSFYTSRFEAVETADGVRQICYKKDSSQQSVSVLLNGEIYLDGKKPEADITESTGTLTLTVTEPYTLTAATGNVLQRDAYIAFVTAVEGCVTATAYYQILENISRIALQKVVDAAYFQCGLDVEQRMIEVRPGFWLHMEQELFMPKDTLQGDDYAGFVGVHSTDYPVTLAKENDDEYLCFDTLLSSMEMDICRSDHNPPEHNAGGGILDLSAVRMREKCYRIHYPSMLYASEETPDVYIGNHIRMEAVPVWKEIPTAQSKLVDSNASKTTVDVVTCLMFRGRSAVSVQMTIVVNGVEKCFPVSTTLGNVMSLMGITENGRSRIQV